MIPILRIIHYIFKKHNEAITEESLDSFFDNGIAFPHFIELIFDEKIPGITDNPVDEMQIKSNNDIALQFLLINNDEIAQASPTYNTEEDRFSLLTLILTKQYFKIDEEDIMKKCNQNLENIYYTNFHDMVGANCIIYLLNALTDGKVQTNTNSEDFNEIMINKFQEAQAPLVIDETSLEPKNQFTFFIQILILFDFFSNNNNADNQIDAEPQNETTTETQEVKQNEESMFDDETILKDSDDSDSSDSKNEYVDDFEKEKLSDQALLIAINSIGSKEKINFKSLNKSIEINKIIKFTSIFFKEENDSKFLSNLNDQNKPFNEKFRELIKFLGKKEPIFNYLIFNFDDPKLRRKSMSLFFTKLLDYFFLKMSKKQLIERCKTILFTRINETDSLYLYRKDIMDPDKEKSILNHFDLYLALVNFANTGNIHSQNIFFESKKSNQFKKLNIPQLFFYDFDENSFKMCKDVISPMYYQLQFIFDAIEKTGFLRYFIELCLGIIRKLSNIKVPKFSTLAAKIIPKNIALIEQNKRFNEFINNQKSVNDIENYKKEVSILYKPETFRERQFERSLHLKKSYKVKKDGFLSSSEDFWNLNDADCSFDLDVLFKGLNSNIDLWNKIFADYEENRITNFVISENNVLFDSIIPQKEMLNLYKFFIFDENEKEWKKNSDSIDKFVKDMNLQNIQAPLILFSHSNENDLITLCSKLIQHSYPKLDGDDQIFVYALCDKQLSLLNYHIDVKQNYNTKPIFLLLHVPESKKNMKNIKAIIYQIYYFLSYICDIEVVVLNKENFIDQISLIENINDFRNSIFKFCLKKNFAINSPIKNCYQDDNNNNQSEDKLQFSSDGDEIEDIENKNNFNQNKDNFLTQLDPNLFKKKAKYILLFNNESINDEYNLTLSVDFIDEKEQKFIENNCHFNFININNTITYKDFLTTFNELASKINNNIDETIKMFDYYELSHMNYIYVVLRFENQWNSKLDEIIKKRFELFRTYNEFGLSEFEILLDLHDEITSTCPYFDDEFITECNVIIDNITKDKSQKNNDFIREEIQASSTNSLDNLKDIINSKFYLSDKFKQNIKISHQSFLENEFFDIIGAISTEKDRSNVFEGNHDILRLQIDYDLDKIDKLFDLFNTEKLKENQQNVVDFEEQKMIGTNYMIRERENVREIKVVVESDNFDEVFENDC